MSDAESASDEESTANKQSASDETADGEPDMDEVDEEQIEAVLSIRQTVQSTADQLVGHPFDGVSEITGSEDGWQAVVEVVERKAVPDTQDVIGRYRIDLDEDGTVQGYRRLDRYRRGDTAAFEPAQ